MIFIQRNVNKSLELFNPGQNRSSSDGMEFERVRRSDAGGGSFDGVAGGRKEAGSRGHVTTDHGEAVANFFGHCLLYN
jgi:hypothetical protein